MAEWFVQVSGKQYGPFDSAKLVKLAAAGKVKPDDLVKKGGDGEWKHAGRVRRLFDAETQANFNASKSSTPKQSSSRQSSSAQRRGSSKLSKPAGADESQSPRRKPKPPLPPAEPLFDLSEDFEVAAAAENPYQPPQALPMASTGFEPGRMGKSTARHDTGWNLFNSIP